MNNSPYQTFQNPPPQRIKIQKAIENQKLTNYLTQVRNPQTPPIPTITNKFVAKEGLLGTVALYENMSKNDLIEKLLMTEQLLKRFYKENKELKE